MKAIVLCAGEGTRLRPLTFSGPKHLIPVANKPVIYRVLNTIKETGITEIGILVSPNVEKEFKTHLKDGSQWGLNIDYIRQEEPKGLAHAVSCAQDFVQQEAFLVYLGDNLLEEGLVDMVNTYHNLSSNALISLYEVENPRQFGVVTLENDKIKNLVEKPEHPPSNLAVIGTYLFDSHIFDAIEKIEPSDRGELEITDAIQELINQGYRVSPYRVKGWWKDVGKSDDMLEVNRLLLEHGKANYYEVNGEVAKDSVIRGRVKLAQSARIKSSELRGPCVIGEDVQIIDSFIGPFTSIDDKVKVVNSEVEYSIIMNKSTLEGIKRLDHSLIGREVTITRKKRVPKAFNFVLGDKSQVELSTEY